MFGTPKSSDVVQSNERTDVYEFIDGNDDAAKLRIIPYIGADFFTGGLAELVLWPLELATMQGSEGRAVVTYDQENRAKTVLVTKKTGHLGNLSRRQREIPLLLWVQTAVCLQRCSSCQCFISCGVCAWMAQVILIPG